MKIANLKLWKKFALLGLLGLVLVSVPSFLFIRDAYKLLEIVRTEARGTGPERALVHVLQVTQQDRGLAALVLGGRSDKAAEQSSKQQEVDKAMQEAGAVLAKAVQDKDVLATWDDVQTSWNSLREKLASRSITGKESTASHTELVIKILAVMDKTADHFGLTLDSEADSYYLINTALYYLPGLAEDLGRLRARGANYLTAQSILPEERVGLLNLREKALERHALMTAAFAKVAAINPDLKERMQKIAEDSLTEAQMALQLANDHIIKAEKPSYSSADYVARLTKAIDSQFTLIDTTISEVETLLQARQTRLITSMSATVLALFALALLSAWLGYVVMLSITRPIRQAVDIAKTVAAGDLTSRIEVTSQNETGELLQALKDMNDSLAVIVCEVRNSAQQVAWASSEIAGGNLDLSSRTEEQASALEETASSMEELTSTVSHNADNAREANQQARNALQVATSGGTVVAEVVETMGAINASAHRATEIISVIDGIAFQTNILALNAAVEAARAGDQGRGFAVVATEVRTLAQRSAAAAKEIKALIEDSVSKVDVGCKLVDQAGTTMNEIVNSVGRMAHIMSEITAASQEQSTGIGQINEAILQMDNATQQNASLVEEVAAVSDSLNQQAKALGEAVSVFRIDATGGSPHTAPQANPQQAPRMTMVKRLAGSANANAFKVRISA